MRIVFITNFVNHHQRPVAECLSAALGNDYHFVTTEPMPEVFIKTGYKPQDNLFFVIPYYKEENKERVKKLVKESDVVIVGDASAPELIELRLTTKKLLLFYSERWHKNLKSYFALPFRYISGTVYKLFTRFNHENAYMLCASAFVPNDCRWAMAYKGKTFKWGYFPPFDSLDIEKLQEARRQHKEIKLLSVCRMIGWKHPELSMYVAKRLCDQGYNFHLTMVGGIYDDDPNSIKVMKYCQDYIKKNRLEKYVEMVGAIKNEDVCRLYEETDIFMFTSDRREGWGAVLNEAMSRGCAVVASDMIGAVPYLIDDKRTGLKFKSVNANDLYNKVAWLIDNKEERLNMGLNAYNHIKNTWAPNVAAGRLLNLCKQLLENKCTTYKEGPCSIADPVKNRFF